MNLLAQILSSKVRSGIFRLIFGTEICRYRHNQNLRSESLKHMLEIIGST